MDGFVRYRIEGVAVDIEVIAATPEGFTARFRFFGDADDEPDWHAVHLTQGPFATQRHAEEAAKSAALARIFAHGSLRH